MLPVIPCCSERAKGVPFCGVFQSDWELGPPKLLKYLTVGSAGEYVVIIKIKICKLLSNSVWM